MEANAEQLKQRLAAQYDKFAAKCQEIFQSGQKRGAEAFEVALDKTREQMTSLGGITTEQAQAFKEYLKRDLKQTAAEASRLGENAKERLHPARVGAGALASLATLMHLGGEAMLNMSRKATEALTYKTGEITSAGTLTCLACGNTMEFLKTGHVPPCPKCQGTAFRKGY